MKRIVVLIDGTWGKEGTGIDTNVAKLDGGRKIVAKRLLKSRSSGGIIQSVHYHDGVGADGGFIKWLLGGAIGLGLKRIIQEAYGSVVADYHPGDEIYIFGFSRGAYAARALAGLIGASGIARRSHAGEFETSWRHYRVSPAARRKPSTATAADQKKIAAHNSLAAQRVFHDSRSVKCVAVWETVGSYGIPAGFGLAPLARYFALATLGFHDTSFGEHVEVGLHAVAVDEHRRAFVPTFWTIPVGQQPTGHVEQTWFAGAHANVGGGWSDSGLSDQALIWMVARVQALTGLEFNEAAIKSETKPNIGGEVEDSTEGIWVLDHYFPHYRAILSPVAIDHGYFVDKKNPQQEHINERVHWSVLAKRQSRAMPSYNPSNLPVSIVGKKIAAITNEERALLSR